MQNVGVCLALTALVVLLSSDPLVAQPRSAQSSRGPEPAATVGPELNLAAAAREAQDAFRPVQAEDVAAAEQQLRAAMQRVERFLAGGPADYAAGWKRYLRWQSLTNQLAQDAPDLDELNRVLVRLFENKEGLEKKPFLQLREALRHYMNVVLFASSPGVEQAYRQQLTELVTRLESYEQQPNPADGEAIGRIIGFLERGGQAGELVAGVRQRFGRPNLYASISERLADEGFRDAVNQTVPVQDCILGTRIRGTAHTTGQVSVDLVPNAELAWLDVRLRATAQSNNVGFNGPVTIYSAGLSQIHAATRLAIHPSGLYAGEAVAKVRTDTTIQDIAAHWRLIEKVAWRRAQQTQPQAERIASQRTEQRVTSEMSQETIEMLKQANENYHQYFRNPLIRRNAFPEMMRIATTDETLQLQARQTGRFNLAAATEPPALAGDFDMTLRLHESAVGNTSEAMLAGMTLTDERVAEMVEALSGDVPEELRIRPEKDPWSITFAAANPVSVSFSDGNQLQIAIRGRQFTRGTEQINYAVEISATYDLEKTDDGARLVRRGPLQVTFINRRRLSAGQIAFKTFLERKFTALFRPEIETTGLQLPGRWRRAGKLRLEQMRAEGGWLSLAWQQAAGQREPVRMARIGE